LSWTARTSTLRDLERKKKDFEQLLNVIAAAGDGGHCCMLRFGTKMFRDGYRTASNLTLCFESPGVCLIVVQYLDRCRQILRQKLLEQIKQLFAIHNVEVATEERSSDVTSAASGSSSSGPESH
jgi:hypothetical protein